MEDMKNRIIAALHEITKQKDIILEKPPKQDMGDFAFPCFSLSKKRKKAPGAIAAEIDDQIRDKLDDNVTTRVIGPYLNFFVSKAYMAKSIISKIHMKKERYGKHEKIGQTVLIESPGPNTNKPLHLGHLRNILLGKTLSNILEFRGYTPIIVNVVNDRGVHICKSMLAYQMYGKNRTPKKSAKKSDHFVGDFYVKYAKAEEKNPELEKEVQQLLIRWEKGDPEVRKLWKKMNKWALSGFAETYKKLEFKIAKEYYESESYLHGKEMILDGLKKGLFKRDKDRSVYVDLEEKGLGKKILLRSNGTSVYITQDIYMAMKRYQDFKFDEMIYVVGNEQDYHFKVLFEIFKKMGLSFADKCYHFSYGMVELPEGKMKSREGTVIDTDDLLDDVIKAAKKEVKKRYPRLPASQVAKRSKKIGMGAMKFFIIKFDPLKNFTFNLQESLSFEGETGPYIQYAYARIASILRKHSKKLDFGDIDFSRLDTEHDRKVLSLLYEYEQKVLESANNCKPSILARYLLDLASAFSEYYHNNQILKAEHEVKLARLALIQSVQEVIRGGLMLLDIDVLEQM